MKFICPKCQSEQDVEVLMDNVKASCVIDLTDPLELKYSYPELHESRNESYCCHKLLPQMRLETTHQTT